MRLFELKKALRELKDLGYVKSERKGPTGIGYTLEECLGIPENNLPIPDVGGRVEIKATRKNSNNLITLFTFDRSVWNLPQAEIIRRWGYVDTKGRNALYSTVSSVEPNAQGLQIQLGENSEMLHVVHVEEGIKLGSWDLFHVVGRFVTKLERLLLVYADARIALDGEEFHYNEAYMLEESNAKGFRDAFLAGSAYIDIRMYLRNNGSVRNHGTAFRIREAELPSLFGRKLTLVVWVLKQ